MIATRPAAGPAAGVADRLRGVWEPAADPGRAVAAAAYMRDRFPFLGLPTPERRRLAAPVLRQLAPADERDLAAVAHALWAQPEREFQYTGCDHLRTHVGVAGPGFIEVVRELVVTKPWWDTVDSLAAHTAGALVREHPVLAELMDEWVRDDDIWLARTALLHQLASKDATDERRLFDHCRARADDPEPFIRKAIGWALRQYAAVAPGAVAAFVAGTPALAPLSVREAMKGVRRATGAGA